MSLFCFRTARPPSSHRDTIDRLFIDCAPVFLFRLWLVAVAVLLTCEALPAHPDRLQRDPSLALFPPQRLNLQSGITAC